MYESNKISREFSIKFARVLIASRSRSFRIIITLSRVTDHARSVQNVTFVERKSERVGKSSIASGKFANFPVSL